MSVIFEQIGNDQTLSKLIEEKIEQAIRSKKFLPDEKLPTEKELCEMFGVSRTALREALQMLSSRGLIYIKKGSGIYVENYSPSNVTRPMHLYLELNFDKNYLQHIIQVRKMLEPQIAGMAALNRTEEDIEFLKHNHSELIKCPKSDYKRQGELDRDFHLALARATKNPMIPLIVEPIFQLMPKVKLMVYKVVSEAKKAALDYHIPIAEAVIRKQEKRAIELMKKHLEIAEEHTRILASKM